MTKKKTLTTTEIAGYCDVNFRTVIRWIERGLLKAHQLPGRGDNRVEIADFVAFLKENNLPIPEAFQDYRGIKHAKGGKPSVLIVDDDPLMVTAIERMLKTQGYETQTATNGFEAGALLSSATPDLMTLDLSMPGMSGLEVIQFVRNLETAKDVKILVISALTPEELGEAVAAGANDALEKPFEPDQLIEKVNNLVGKALSGVSGASKS
ncbi:MAG: response regulator [Vampirovibrio sp.]|nr:response regulator [Vampirovibrio sp.]